MVKEIFGGVIPLLETLLDVRLLRHKLISSNIANEETPGYKARDLEFQEELDKMIRGERGIQLVSTHEDHFSAPGPGDITIRMVIKEEGGLGLDDNTVSLEREMVKLAENTLMYNATATMLAKKFQLLREAINEGR